MQAKGGATNGRGDGRVRDATCLDRRLARFGEADATAPARRHAASARVSGFRVRAGGRGAPEARQQRCQRRGCRCERLVAPLHAMCGAPRLSDLSFHKSETLSKQVKRGLQQYTCTGYSCTT